MILPPRGCPPASTQSFFPKGHFSKAHCVPLNKLAHRVGNGFENAVKPLLCSAGCVCRHHRWTSAGTALSCAAFHKLTIHFVGHDHAVIHRAEPAGHDDADAAGVVQAGDLLRQRAAHGEAFELRAEARAVDVLACSAGTSRASTLRRGRAARGCSARTCRVRRASFRSSRACSPRIPRALSSAQSS